MLQDRGRCDSVGQVGHHLGRHGIERGEIERQRVAEVQRRVAMRRERVAQRGLQRAVDLDDVRVRGALREMLGQHAEPAADLQRDVLGRQLRRAFDDPQDVGVDQEVLAEVALGPHVERAHAAQARLRRQAGCRRLTHYQ